MEFADRTVVITGVGRDGQLGEAVAEAFARRGAHLVLVDRTEEGARARAAGVAAVGGSATALAADLAHEGEVRELAERIARASGGAVGALVHLAGGFASSGPVAESDPAVWQHLYTINVLTAYLTTRALLPLLRVTRGSIVLFASEAALPGARVESLSAYAAAKSAVSVLARAIAAEEAPHGVRANALAPAAIRTAANVASMGADARYVTREAVADVTVWLTTEAARAVSGQTLRVR